MPRHPSQHERRWDVKAEDASGQTRLWPLQTYKRLANQTAERIRRDHPDYTDVRVVDGWEPVA